MSDTASSGDGEGPSATRDKPWIFRTYAGHSSAAASNALYRQNLARGQTGLSVAFDLPTQTGYDADHVLARGEVGKVGVPISHLGDMRTLFRDLPLDRMNTSMTINATAPWLLALYVAVAEEQGTARGALAGTVQNDIIKEYLSRGTHIFPPVPSMRLTTDVIAFALHEMPKWNPINVCSYHLQEAGATPVQELAFALANACAVLDAVKAAGAVAAKDFPRLAGRISFFVNAGIRFITEMCKMRAFTELWDEILRQRYGIEDPAFRRFRYGVQVNSLGLTEQQPENNVYRILLETLAVVLSKDARARAVQLPAWNEALGLPRPWDQQWSLRLQQILAHETDLLDYDDIFRGAEVVAAKVKSLKDAAMAELDRIVAQGGAVAAVENGTMKQALVASNSRRINAIISGETMVVGVNAFTESEPSPLVESSGEAFLTVAANAEAAQIEQLQAWRARRKAKAVKAALSALRQAATEGRNVIEPSIACAKAGVTTGEWADSLREVFGEYRAPTGIGEGLSPIDKKAAARVREKVGRSAKRHGRPLKILIGKPGLDGHSNGAEQIAVAARECGIEVVYQGIRLTPAEIVDAALEEGVHLIGLSVLSGSHLALAGAVVNELQRSGLDIPVVLGGIIPPDDANGLKAAGIAAVYTPKDYDLMRIIEEIVDVIDENGAAAA